MAPRRLQHPTPPRTRRERVAQKERGILDAARDAFVEHGYDGARISDIARHAGVSEGSIYSYYETKSDLMRAVVSEFWERITTGAVEAIQREITTRGKIAALARFHLVTVMENFDFVELTFTLRRRPDALGGSKDQMRDYVKILDDVIHQGVDRGDLPPGLELWLVRDMFYGTLEYAARTLLQRGRSSGSKEAKTAIEHLVDQIVVVHGAPAVRSEPAPRDMEADSALSRLDALVRRLETILSTRTGAGGPEAS